MLLGFSVVVDSDLTVVNSLGSGIQWKNVLSTHWPSVMVLGAVGSPWPRAFSWDVVTNWKESNYPWLVCAHVVSSYKIKSWCWCSTQTEIFGENRIQFFLVVQHPKSPEEKMWVWIQATIKLYYPVERISTCLRRTDSREPGTSLWLANQKTLHQQQLLIPGSVLQESPLFLSPEC
jgi:hypothetical protein